MLTLYIQREDTSSPDGRVCFVDLAGSERLAETHTHGQALKETGHINKSLFALSNVISALADTKKRGGHIPYRDSKLTHLLKDSLGGDGRTLMLACCSPSSHHLDETINTLQFASRTKNIQQNRLVVQQPQADAQAVQVQQLQAELLALQEENAGLRRERAHLSVPLVHPTGCHQEVMAVEQEVRQLRSSNELLQRSHDALLRDNQQLKTKLERLEEVFAGANDRDS